ncbi:MAG: hypothetical protein Q9168_007754, partial [Polycauliona sp. 1 TL-2023]
MLVKARYRKGGHVYHGWLGGDEGYSDEIIAHHKDLPRLVLSLRLYARKQNLDAEDVLNEYDITKEALEAEEDTPMPMTPPSTGSIKDTRDSDSTLTSPPSESDSDDPITLSRASRKRSSGKEKATKAKKKAKVTSSDTASPTFRRSTQTMQDLKRIDDPELRAEVQRLHRMFPTVSVTVWESILLKNKGNADDAIDDFYNLQNVSSSTNTIVSEDGLEDGPPAVSTRSRRANLTVQANMPQTPSTPRTNSFSPAQQLGTPFSSHQSPRSYGYPTPQTPSTSFRAVRNPTTTFQFFLSDPSMGAIPIPFSDIKSKIKLFNEATAAHFLTSATTSEAENESVVALSII